jgi:hypothetical protein
MYTAYFVNVIEGWLLKIHSPEESPIGKWEGWKEITEDEYKLYVIIQSAEYPN